jgi:hypothetical protein
LSLEEAINRLADEVETNNKLLKLSLEQRAELTAKIDGKKADADGDAEPRRGRGRPKSKKDEDQDPPEESQAERLERQEAEIAAAEKAKGEPADDDDDDRAARRRRREAEAEDDKKPAPKKGKEKPPTVDEVRAAFGEFMNVEDEELRAKRKDFVLDMFDHLEVKKAVEIVEEQRAQAIEWLKMRLGGAKNAEFPF